MTWQKLIDVDVERRTLTVEKETGEQYEAEVLKLKTLEVNNRNREIWVDLNFYGGETCIAGYGYAENLDWVGD